MRRIIGALLCAIAASWLGGVAAHFVGGEEEDAVPGEELAAIGLGDGTDDVRTTRKVFHQCVRRLTGRFRGRRVDDREHLAAVDCRARGEDCVRVALVGTSVTVVQVATGDLG